MKLGRVCPSPTMGIWGDGVRGRAPKAKKGGSGRVSRAKVGEWQKVGMVIVGLGIDDHT